MPHLEVDGIRKTYGSVTAVEDMSFSLEEGDLLTLLGPSGCGKTTTLDIIAGLIRPDRGDIFIDGKRVNDLGPENRDSVKVFQEYALFPHMTVGQNVGFGLKMDNVAPDEREVRVMDSLEMVQLGGLADRRVDELSGGQRQRVATARALVKEPAVLLLDEPFSALDLKLREQLQVELKKLQEELGITTIHVTHDQEEAMVLSDTIVVMNDGTKLQEGSPMDIYESPSSEFVASFIGKSNLFDGVIVENGSDGYVAESSHSGTRFHGVSTGEDSMAVGDEITICLRPEKCDMQLGTPEPGAENVLPATVEHKFVLGSIVQYRLSVDEPIHGDQPDVDFIIEDKNLAEHGEFGKGTAVSISCRPEFVKLIKG